MLAKGLFGVVSRHHLDSGKIVTHITQQLSLEECFAWVASADGKAFMGAIASTVVAYPFRVEAAEESQTIAVRDGVLFSDSIFENTPTALFASSLSLPSHANGMFVCAAYKPGHLRMLSDPFGSLPLYWQQKGDAFVFSSSLKLVLNFPGMPRPPLSESGFSQWLCWQTILDGTTLFENIFRMQSAELLDYDVVNGKVRTQRYWAPTVDPATKAGKLHETVSAFEQAVTRVLTKAPQPLAASLSGGLDSRTIWTALLHMKQTVPAITHGAARGYDVTIAEMIAKKLGLHHSVVMLGEEFLSAFGEHCDGMVDASNSMLSAENAHLPYLYRKHLGGMASVVDGNHSSIEGRWALRNTAQRIRSQEDFFEAFWKQLFRPRLASLLSETKSKHVIEQARAVLHSIIPDPKHWASPGCAADVWNVQYLLGAHGTDGACLQNHFNRYLTPYYDLDYVDVIGRIPEASRWKQEPQYAIIRACAPELLAFPRCYADVKTSTSGNAFLLRLPVAWHRIVIPQLKRVLPERIIRRIDPYHPSMLYRSWFRNELASMVHLLAADHRFFDPVRMKHFVDEYQAERSDDVASIAMLLTMASPTSVFQHFVSF